MNDNLGGGYFGGTEAIRPTLGFMTLFFRDQINNPHLRQDDLIAKERNTKRNKHNVEHIIIKLPRGEKIMTTNLSHQNKNIPLNCATTGLND